MEAEDAIKSVWGDQANLEPEVIIDPDTLPYKGWDEFVNADFEDPVIKSSFIQKALDSGVKITPSEGEHFMESKNAVASECVDTIP